MAGNVQPLDQKFPVVKSDGTPTDYFIRWAQNRQIDISGGITAEQAVDIIVQYLADHELHEGSGIQLTPSGNISDNPTIAADVQEILDQISTTRGSVIYRGLLGWTALGPGASGTFLKSNGAGADPTWGAAAGGSTRVLAALFPGTGNATDLFASLGYYVTFPVGCTVISIAALLRPGAIGRTYTLNYAPFNPATGKITAAPTIARTFTATAVTTLLQVTADLTVPLVVTAGQTYAFWVSQTFSTTTTTPDTYFSTTGLVSSYYFNVPINQGIKLASNAPLITDTWTTAGAQWAMSFLYTVP